MKRFIILFFTFFSTITQSQNLSLLPPIYNYSQTQYKAGMQNWQVSQCQDGILYVANNQGLLTFDGQVWQLYYLPQKKIARSVFADSSTSNLRVYVGSFEEFGYFQRNAQNQLVYTSLKDQLKNYTFHNDEVWQIFKYQDKIYFQTFSSYFVYDGSHVQAFTPQPAPFAMFPYGNKLYMQGMNAGFYRIDATQKLNLELSPEQLGGIIVEIIPYQSELLLITNKNGFFRYNPATSELRKFPTEMDALFPSLRINRALLTANNLLILGTLTEGLYAINPHNGKIFGHIHKKNGLNNNTVLGLYEDAQHNLWVALDNGVAMIEVPSRLRYLNLNGEVELISDMVLKDNVYYLASNKGVYTFKEGVLSKIPDFSNQVWFIKQFDHQVFVGHNKGVSELMGNHLQPLDNVGVGGMDLKKGVIHGQEVLVGSSYSVLTIYKKDAANRWVPSHIVNGYFDLTYRVEIDAFGNIWTNHTYKGVSKLSLTEDLKNVQRKVTYNQLKTKEALKLLKLRGKIIFTDGQQWFEYNDDKQNVLPYALLNEQLPQLATTHHIVPVNDNRFWFITPTDYYLVAFANGVYKIEEKIAFNQLQHPASEERATAFVTPEGNTYFCLDGSIALYTPKAPRVKLPTNLTLKSLRTYNRSTDLYTLENITPNIAIPYSKNNLQFDFQYPNFSKEHCQLWYQLEGYDKHWREVTNDFRVNYQNLPSGHYQLKAKVLNELGETLSHYTFPFAVITPWYRTVWAYIFYFAGFIGAGALVTALYLRYKMKKKERSFLRERLRRQRLLEAREQEVTKLQNQVLIAQLDYKSKSLAEATMMNITRNEFLTNLVTELETLLNSQRVSKAKSNLILQHIRDNISQEDQWQVFQENFDLIHKDFFKKLKELYPQLTPTDLRMAVLIRLNYTSKEIAEMQNISLRGVETARYRLRKKLQLAEEDNLYDFFAQFN